MKAIYIFIASFWFVNLALGQTPCTTNPGTLSLYCGSSTICVGGGVCMELTGYTGEIVRWERKNGSGGWADVGLGGFSTNTGEAFSTAETVKFRVVVKCTSDPNEQTSNELSIVVNAPTTAASASGTYGVLRHSTARFTLGADTYTGFLVNHTSNDGRLLFLTTSEANACHTVNWNNVVFTWLSDGTVTTSTGATLLTTDNKISLFELNEAPDIAELTYLGWDISTSPSSVSCIFESSNNTIVKGIVSAGSISTVNLTTYCNGTYSETSGTPAIKVSSWSAGEPTSSGRGAPLIMNNKKVMGVYIAGNETACNKGPSCFADLVHASSTLLPYLRDGSETNTATVKMNYCKPFLDNLPSPLTLGETYTVTGHIVSSQFINDGITVKYQAGTYIELNNEFYSGTDFVAEINPCVIYRTIIAAKTDDLPEEAIPYNSISSTENFIRIYPTVLPSGHAINVVATEEIEKVQLEIYDLQSKRVFQTTLYNLAAYIPNSVSLIGYSAGLYLVKAMSDNLSTTQKIIVK